MSDTYVDLGWMNDWSTFPEAYKKCLELKHKKRDISHCEDGSHHEVICDICHTIYHYDSSG